MNFRTRSYPQWMLDDGWKKAAYLIEPWRAGFGAYWSWWDSVQSVLQRSREAEVSLAPVPHVDILVSAISQLLIVDYLVSNNQNNYILKHYSNSFFPLTKIIRLLSLQPERKKTLNINCTLSHLMIILYLQVMAVHCIRVWVWSIKRVEC